MKNLNYYLHISKGCGDCPFEGVCNFQWDCIVLQDKMKMEAFMDSMGLTFDDFMALMEWSEVMDYKSAEADELLESNMLSVSY